VATETDTATPGAWTVIRIPADGKVVRQPPASSQQPAVPSSASVLSPDGAWSATPTAKRTAWSIAIRPFHSGSALVRQADRQKDLAITSAEPVSRVQVLAWSAAGIYLRVETSRGPGYSTHRSIRVIDPGTAATTVVSRPADGLGTFPIALASGLVTSATPIPVARPGILE
jgi:hypothetical protein